MVVILDFDELSSSGNTVAYLLDMHSLSATNNKTVSQAVEFNNVRVFNSDNVGYMKKAFNDTLSCLFPLCVHITCNSVISTLKYLYMRLWLLDLIIIIPYYPDCHKTSFKNSNIYRTLLPVYYHTLRRLNMKLRYLKNSTGCLLLSELNLRSWY